MIGYYDNPVDHKGESVAQIADGIYSQVEGMSVEDICFDLHGISSMHRLEEKVYQLIQDTYRGAGISDTLDILLDELLTPNTLSVFIVSLGLENQVREMFANQLIDEALNT